MPWVPDGGHERARSLHPGGPRPGMAALAAAPGPARTRPAAAWARLLRAVDRAEQSTAGRDRPRAGQGDAAAGVDVRDVQPARRRGARRRRAAAVPRLAPAGAGAVRLPRHPGRHRGAVGRAEHADARRDAVVPDLRIRVTVRVLVRSSPFASSSGSPSATPFASSSASPAAGQAGGGSRLAAFVPVRGLSCQAYAAPNK